MYKKVKTGFFSNLMLSIDNTQHRKIRSVPRVKLLNLKRIFKFSTHKQQEAISIQMFICFASLNLTVLTAKRAWNGFNFFPLFHLGFCLLIPRPLVTTSFLKESWPFLYGNGTFWRKRQRMWKLYVFARLSRKKSHFKKI